MPTSSPRILFLDHTATLGGGELYLLDVAKAYADSSRVVLFSEGPFADRLRSEDIPTSIVPAPKRVLDVPRKADVWDVLQAIPGVFRFVFQIARLARDYDLVFANSQKSMLIGALASTLARRPFVWNLHDLLTADHFTALNRRLAVTVANWTTTRIIVNSKATRSALAEAGGRVDHTHVVYNGLGADAFDALSAEAGPSLRSTLGLDGAPLLGVFSRLAPWKGQHVLIDALAQLPEVHALLVGDALFEGDVPYVDELKSRARSRGVSERVHFLGFRDDVPALMKACDAIVHTSVAPEPFGRVIVEGMLARRPVVATRAGGPLEIVEDGQTGRLVPPNDAEALATAVQSLLNDPARAKSLAEAGRKRAEERFSVSSMIEGVDEVLTAALNDTNS